MGATSFLRSLSRLQSGKRSSSSTVTPLPEQSRFSKEVTAKLDTLRSSEHEYASASWLVDVLDATIITQKAAQEQMTTSSSSNVTLSRSDKEMIESYLEDNVELLDACNGLVEKIDVVHKYVDSLQGVTRSLAMEGVQRSQEMFKECIKVETQCATMDKCSPKLNRLMGRKEINVNGEQDFKLHEALSGSREVASMGCHLLQRGLSFKSRQGVLKTKSKLSTTWSSSLNELQVILNEAAEGRKKSSPWMMNELEKIVMDVRFVQDQMKSQKRSINVDDLRRNCRALEEEMEPLEERVKELYKLLISIRMVLLGILSRN
ncbi:hypothetical protein SOVF_204800 [Spinacia oleracea]|nr:hypothetical protein SOVF_204800 [Spinacia oleracea]